MTGYAAKPPLVMADDAFAARSTTAPRIRNRRPGGFQRLAEDSATKKRNTSMNDNPNTGASKENPFDRHLRQGRAVFVVAVLVILPGIFWGITASLAALVAIACMFFIARQIR
jgi:hypothetical protein